MEENNYSSNGGIKEESVFVITLIGFIIVIFLNPLLGLAFPGIGLGFSIAKRYKLYIIANALLILASIVSIVSVILETLSKV